MNCCLLLVLKNSIKRLNNEFYGQIHRFMEIISADSNAKNIIFQELQK